MTDTIRTLSELNQLFKDNTTGDIGPQEHRDVFASQNVHCEMGLTNWTNTVNNAWEQMPLNIEGVFQRGFVANPTTHLIEQTPVRIKAICYIELDVDSISDGTLDVAAFVSGVQDPTTRRTVRDPQHISWSNGIQLNQDDTIGVYVRADFDNVNVVVNRALLRVQRIGLE